jgi:SAM-dependent methyltransferase
MLYDAVSTHRLLVRDSARTEAFRRAIRATVRPGDVVLDVGAGSGILSLFAAQAGAARVYAVERTPIARLARRLAQVNGAAAIVRVIEGPVEAVRLPERVDVIVSEWLGSIGVDENLLGVVLLARDRWLKPGRRLVPRRVTAWMAPAYLPQRPDVAFFRRRPYGLDLTPLVEPSVHELLSYRRRVTPADLVAPPLALWDTDVGAVPAERAALPARAVVDFVAPRPAAVNGLVAWFSAELADGVGVSNAPDAPDTHWGQLLLPLEREHAVAPGDVLAAQVVCIPADGAWSHLAWSVRVGAGSWEHHDTRLVAGGAPAAAPAPARPAPPGPAGGARARPTGRPPKEEPHPMGAALRGFLARLAVEPTLLSEFIKRPTEVMAEAGLTDEERQAMMSHDQSRIQAAIVGEVPGSPAAPPPTGRPRAGRSR